MWIGDTAAPLHTYSGDDNAGPDVQTSQATGSEPRDVAPTWIGDTAAPQHTYSGDDNAGPDVQNTTGDGDLAQ